MMKKKVRFLIVGAGRGRTHVRSIKSLGNEFELAGVVDLDVKRLHQLCDEEEIDYGQAYTSLETALEQSCCDAVVVATWARTHEVIVRQALEAGANVLVEKPFTSTIKSAQGLLKLADADNLKIMVVQQWRYLPGQRTMRRLLGERRYGQPQTGHMFSYKARDGEYPDSSHSQLWQMTVHEIDSLLSMIREPVVAVNGHSYHPPATKWKRESAVTAELMMRSGCHIVLASTSEAKTDSFELRLECELGSLRYRNEISFGVEEKIEVSMPNSGTWQPIAIDSGSVLTLDQQVVTAFGDWVLGGQEPETSGRRNLQVLGVLDALLESGKSDRRVTVAEA